MSLWWSWLQLPNTLIVWYDLLFYSSACVIYSFSWIKLSYYSKVPFKFPFRYVYLCPFWQLGLIMVTAYFPFMLSIYFLRLVSIQNNSWTLIDWNHLSYYEKITKPFGGARFLYVISTKDGWYIFMNKKVMTIFVRHDFIAEYMNFTRNRRELHSDLGWHHFDDQY